MQDKTGQDEVVMSGPQLRPPPQARPVPRELLASGMMTTAEGIQPQILLICPYEGPCMVARA